MKGYAFRNPPGIVNIKMSEFSDCGHPLEGEVRVRIRASSLNGHDLNVVRGILPVSEGRILLTDGAGTVEEVGPGVGEFEVGDSVISTFFPDWIQETAPAPGFARTPGDGLDGYAVEQVVRHQNFFTRAPEGWSFAEAATLPTAGLTAWRALVIEGNLSAGQHVLVLGTGGVSILALQIAKAMRSRVTVTSASDEKLEQAARLGADHVVNYRKRENWAQHVLEVTEGRGVDLTLETGGAGTLPQSIQATRVGGRIILIGVVTGTTRTIPTAALMGKQQQLRGIMVGSRPAQIEMVRSLRKLGIRPYIGRSFAFNQLREAMEYQDSRQHVGKVAITY